MKKILIILMVFTLFIGGEGYCQIKQEPISSKQKQGNFKKKTFSSNPGNNKGLPPPPPDDGWSSPIPGGIYFLILGASAYFYRKAKNEKKYHK